MTFHFANIRAVVSQALKLGKLYNESHKLSAHNVFQSNSITQISNAKNWFVMKESLQLQTENNYPNPSIQILLKPQIRNNEIV